MTDSWKFNGDVGEEREIPALRLTVKTGDVFQVEDAEVSKGLQGQTAFEKVKAKASVPASDKKD
jgi:hypothetical protein